MAILAIDIFKSLVSNLNFISKIIEKVVHKQLTAYATTNDSFSKFQSGYRKSHGCETAVVKIHNDILLMMDTRSNVVLLLLDLSAAFDTISHNLLIRKLENMYGISGVVIKWLKSYLADRSFKVVVKQSSSSMCKLEIGVPQGSILGPLLFILYTKDLQYIVTKYGFSIHLYADDTQVYFSFDVNCENPDMSHVDACFKDIKRWMAANYLQLNGSKTEFLEIGRYETNVQSLTLDSITLEPCKSAKNLGFMFDHLLLLNDQVNSVSQSCHNNLRNLRRIGSKLSFDLKVQLVHSMVHSVIDYCNGAYGGLSEANIKKLQKLQYAGVRFIFGLKKFCHEHMSPYMKKLHFLPVKQRIDYKICLLIFKCLNNIAPRYLSDMVKLRNPKRQSLRLDDDFYRLQVPPKPQLHQTEGAFYFCGPQIWNKLPYELRCLSDLDTFKKRLKTHFFMIAYNGVLGQ